MDRTEDTVAPSADRLLVRYRVRSDAGRIEARAAALALEQSVEMPAEAITDEAIRANVPGRVEGIRALPREAPHLPIALLPDLQLRRKNRGGGGGCSFDCTERCTATC